MIAENIVDYAIKSGASEAEVYLAELDSMSVNFTSKDKKILTTTETGLGIRVAVGKRLGFVSTSILSENEAEKAAIKALKIAKASPEDPYWSGFNKKRGSASVKDLYDRSITALTPLELVELVDDGLKIVSEYDPRVTPAAGAIEATKGKITYVNNHIDELSRSSTMISGYMYAKAEDNGKQSTGSEDDQSRNLSGFNFEKTSQEAAVQSLRYLDAKPLKGGEMAVIIKNDVFGSFLSVMLSSPINALSVQRGTSPLAGKIGEKIGTDNITLTDEGAMPGGIVSRPFDDEGHRTQTTTVIDEGTLITYLYDNYTGNKDDHESTGNAFRNGYRSEAIPSTSNLVLRPSDASFDELISSTQNGLYIESVIGEWLSNSVSSELNATVTHGHLVENGELSQPVKGVVLAGNFLDIIKRGIEVVGSDVKQSGGVYSPTVKISKLTIAGN